MFLIYIILYYLIKIFLKRLKLYFLRLLHFPEVLFSPDFFLSFFTFFIILLGFIQPFMLLSMYSHKQHWVQNSSCQQRKKPVHVFAGCSFLAQAPWLDRSTDSRTPFKIYNFSYFTIKYFY